MRALALSVVASMLAACAPVGSRAPAALAQAGVPPAGPVTTLPPPPLTEGIFPCSDCHGALETNPTPRKLEQHDEIVLRHGDRERWCFDCHAPDDRDQLRLASGRLVPLAQSQELCRQCHGDKQRDWRTGVHGKRVGSWNGAKEAWTCTQCHHAHAPRFQALAPLPAPPRPAELRASR